MKSQASASSGLKARENKHVTQLAGGLLNGGIFLDATGSIIIVLPFGGIGLHPRNFARGSGWTAGLLRIEFGRKRRE
jgi:hypothetical protein